MAKKRDPEVKKKFLAKLKRKRAPAGMQVDHIVALEDGGRDSMANMQLLTKKKHQEKTNREAKARAKKTSKKKK